MVVGALSPASNQATPAASARWIPSRKSSCKRRHHRRSALYFVSCNNHQRQPRSQRPPSHRTTRRLSGLHATKNHRIQQTTLSDPLRTSARPRPPPTMVPALRSRLALLARRTTTTTTTTSQLSPTTFRTSYSSSPFQTGPAPPRLPADQQAEFERLQRTANIFADILIPAVTLCHASIACETLTAWGAPDVNCGSRRRVQRGTL